MDIITIGSKVMDDAVNRSGGKLKNVGRIVDISPLSFCEEFNLSVKEVEKTQFIDSLKFPNDYAKKMFEYDFCKNMKDKLKDVKAEYLIFDLSIIRIGVYEFVFKDGSHYRLTKNQSLLGNIEQIRSFLQKNRGGIVEERIINPFKLANESIQESISKYIAYLSNIKGKNIACVQIKNVGQYISKKNMIELLEHQNVIYDTNVFYERCYDILFAHDTNVKVIECPEFLICDERICTKGMFNYNMNYYSYIYESILALDDEKFEDIKRRLKEKYETKQKLEIEDIMIIPLLHQTSIKYRDRKIVLIGKCDSFEYLLKKQYGLSVDRVIDFNESTSSQELEKNLEEIKNKDEEFFCVVPFVCKDILNSLWKYGYGYAIGYYSMIHLTYKLENFVGHYEDIYNNVIDCEKPVTLEIRGCGNKVSIKSGGKNFRIILLSNCVINVEKNIEIEENFSMRIYDGACVQIGKNSKIKKDSHIRGSFFTKTEIGENCVIGERVVLFNGDGHAIIDIKTGENLNYAYKADKIEKYQIVLKDRAFIGDDTFILSGSYIGSESVVRENSFVNKKFGNRQYIGGHPAKVIQDGIKWRC